MPSLSRRNRITALAAVCAAGGMVGLAYASVPLYDLFCRATGYGGTTQIATEAPQAVGSREFVVRFNADVSRDMPWRFRAGQGSVKVRAGEEMLVHYVASNPTSRPLRGVATFNVTPDKAGAYFDKIACFCFEEQTLEPGQEVQMPVSFFVDPAILGDPRAADVKTITLSYTFFPSPEQPVRFSEAGTGTGREPKGGGASNGNSAAGE